MNWPTELMSSHFLVWLATMGIVTWFTWDMRSILKDNQRKNQLSIEGRWKDLENHYENAAKTYRPFVWLHRRYLLPGNLAVQHAMFLHKQGRLDEALAKTDQAIRQIANKPKLFSFIHRNETFGTLRGALRGRALILTGMGRYEEVRQVAAQMEQLTGTVGRPNPSLALLEYYCGRLDEALAHAREVAPGDSQYDAMRGIMAFIYCLKEDFDAALQALVYEPAHVRKFYSAEGLEALRSSPEGAKLIELKQKKLAGVFQPSQFLKVAMVYVARKDFENAGRALDVAEKSLGPEPGLQLTYCRFRACSLAGLGKADEAEAYIQRMRAMVQQLPKRSLLRESHMAAGQSYFYLGRFSDAVAELIEAQKFDLHPIDKHVTAYWIAQSYEAAGRRREALPYYKTVAADPIPSWMRTRAAEAITRLNI